MDLDVNLYMTSTMTTSETIEAAKGMFPDYATIFACVCACLFTVVGVIGNLITLLALVRCPKLRNHATTAFIISLCISDLLFCSISMPLQAIRYAMKEWTLGETLCQIFPVVLYGNVAVSLLSMVCITLNRYILISYNHLYSIVYTPRNIVIQLLSVWGVAFLLMVPPLLGVYGRLGLDAETFSCTILKDEHGRSPKKMLFLFGILLPCIIIIISYTCIYYTVRRQRLRLRAHSQEPPKTSCALTQPMTTSNSTGGSAPIAKNCRAAAQNTKREREDSRLTGMMLTIFLCFLLCFLPLMFANVFDKEIQVPFVHVLASVMCWASGVINPFIYAASNRTYRIAYMKLFNKIKFWGRPTMLSSTGSAGSNNNNNVIAGVSQNNNNNNSSGSKRIQNTIQSGFSRLTKDKGQVAPLPDTIITIPMKH